MPRKGPGWLRLLAQIGQGALLHRCVAFPSGSGWHASSRWDAVTSTSMPVCWCSQPSCPFLLDFMCVIFKMQFPSPAPSGLGR